MCIAKFSYLLTYSGTEPAAIAFRAVETVGPFKTALKTYLYSIH